MPDDITVTPSESPTSFSDLPASAWQEPTADAGSGEGSQPSETPAADATAAITPASRDSAPPDVTPREGADGGTDKPGPIPFDRHEAVLKPIRERAEAAEAKWQRIAWAEELASAGRSPEQIKEALQLYDGIDGHPDKFLETFYERLSNHPHYASLVRSWAGRVLAGHKAPAEDDPEPQPVYYTATDPATGQPGRYLSDQYQREWKAWYDRQQDKRLDAKIAPLVQDKQQREQREQLLTAANTLYKQEFDTMKADWEHVKTLPYAEKYKADIKAEVVASGHTISLHRAYANVLNKVLPDISQSERAKVLSEFRTQANGSGLQPKSPATTTPGPAPKNFRDLPPEAWK